MATHFDPDMVGKPMNTQNAFEAWLRYEYGMTINQFNKQSRDFRQDVLQQYRDRLPVTCERRDYDPRQDVTAQEITRKWDRIEWTGDPQPIEAAMKGTP